jgi:hypothetical protein
MNSSELIEAIENDRSSSSWLLEQVRQISKRDIIDQIRDVETLKKVLELEWDELEFSLAKHQIKISR